MKIEFEYYHKKFLCEKQDVRTVLDELFCVFDDEVFHLVQESDNDFFHVAIEMDKLTKNNKSQVVEIIEKYLNLTFSCDVMNVNYQKLLDNSLSYFDKQMGGGMVEQVVEILRGSFNMENDFKEAFMSTPYFLVAAELKKLLEGTLKIILNSGLEEASVQEQVIVARDEYPDEAMRVTPRR